MIKITQRSVRVPFVTLKKGKRIIEVRGTIHIAERQFFRELYRTNTVIHHEDIRHDGQVNYSLMSASAFGLDSQKDYIPKRVNVFFRYAHRQVIETFFHVKKMSARKYFLLIKKNLRRVHASELGKIMIVDRDEIAALHADVAQDKNIVLVWGAAHVVGIVKNLQMLGWKRKSTRLVSAVYLRNQGEKSEN